MDRIAELQSVQARTVPPVVRRARPDDHLPFPLWLSVRPGPHPVDFDSVLRPQTIQLPDGVSVYLSDLAKSNPGKFIEYMSTLLEGDVERIGYLIRFCSGRNKKAAECVLELIKKQLSFNNKNTPVECERYVSLQRIMMLALFEAKLGSTANAFMSNELIKFPYELTGEDLLAADYFIQNLPERSSFHVSDITITCQVKADLDLLR